MICENCGHHNKEIRKIKNLFEKSEEYRKKCISCLNKYLNNEESKNIDKKIKYIDINKWPQKHPRRCIMNKF